MVLDWSARTGRLPLLLKPPRATARAKQTIHRPCEAIPKAAAFPALAWTGSLPRQGPLDIKREERNLQPMSQTLQYLTDERGDRTAVVLPISDYENLLEDLDDLAVVAERRDEPVIPHDEFLAELQRDGVL